MRMSEPKRLHPIAVISNALKLLKEMIFPILAATVFGGRGADWGNLLFPIGAVMFALISGILSWLRFSYRLEENELRIESGVFVRKKRYIPFERIQSVNQSEGIFQRPFGLVKLKIETAAGGKDETEADLTAITKAEADFIRAMVAEGKGNLATQPEECTPEKQVIYKISTQELFLLALTSGGVGVILSAIFAFFAQFDELLPFERIFDQFESFISSGILLVGLALLTVFVFVWLLALGSIMLKYARFTVTKTKDDLVISKGLIEKRQITVPLNRIQAIRISQNLFRQPLGYATVFLENAGGAAEDGNTGKIMLLPLVKKKEVEGILGKWVPEYQLAPTLQTIPNHALRRYFFRGWLVLIPLLALSLLFLRPWGWLALILIGPVLYWQYLSFRDSGWSIFGDQLTLQYRDISKHIVFMKKRKIQAVGTNESFFQTKKQLSTIQASVKSGGGGAGGRVVDIGRKDAVQILQWFSYDRTS